MASWRASVKEFRVPSISDLDGATDKPSTRPILFNRSDSAGRQLLSEHSQPKTPEMPQPEPFDLDFERDECTVATDDRLSEQTSEQMKASLEATAASKKGKKRKALSSAKSKSKPADKRFQWNAELVELLLRLTKEYKTKCDFNGIDFEADGQQMYTNIRRSLGRDFPDEFGREEISEPDKQLRMMEKEEYARFMQRRTEEQDLIAKGYKRVKEKIKNVRQEYRNALREDTRSGSGRIIQENFELLGEIWGGSPATTSLSFGVNGDSVGELQTGDGDKSDSESYGADDNDSSSPGNYNRSFDSCENRHYNARK